MGRAGRKMFTPVPRNDDGSIDWQALRNVIGLVVGVLGIGGAGGYAFFHPADGAEAAQLIASERDELVTLRRQAEQAKENRLTAIEGRLERLERVVNRIAVKMRVSTQ